MHLEYSLQYCKVYRISRIGLLFRGQNKVEQAGTEITAREMKEKGGFSRRKHKALEEERFRFVM